MPDRISDELWIEAIFDLRRNPQSNSVHADSYLQALSDAEWAEFREDATASGKVKASVIQCGDCRQAVYARESLRGRRHCYHFGGAHKSCRWSDATGRRIRSIDAEKFRGQQEGDQHKDLCNLIAEVLALDKDTEEAGIERRPYVKLSDGQYAYPDVYARNWQGAPAAFEIQLSTTHMPVIIRREKFYERGLTRLVWIVGHRSESFHRRSFKDIYMRNDGQVLGIDEEVAVAARAERSPKFRLYRLLPGSTRKGFAAQWRDRIVGAEQIEWGEPGSRPRSAQRSFDEYLDATVMQDDVLVTQRRAFYGALKEGNEKNAGTAWDITAKIVGGLKWFEFPEAYETAKAFGVLATLRTGELCVPTKISPKNYVSLVNSMLLEPQARRCWTHALDLMCRSLGLIEVLNTTSVKEKCNRNHEEAANVVPIDVEAGAVFNAMFPEGAFRRVNLNALKEKG